MTKLKASADRLEVIQTEIAAMLLAVPNLPHDSVPVGADESGNVEVRRWGTPATYSFEVKDHVDVGRAAGSGFRDRCEAVGLALHLPARARPPACTARSPSSCWTCRRRSTATPSATRLTSVQAKALQGTGQLPKFEQDLFHVTSGDGEASDSKWYLIPTSEVTLTNSVADTIVPLEQLPIKLTAHSPVLPLGGGQRRA